MSLRRWLCLSVTLLIIIAIAAYFWLKSAHPDVLWHIVNQQCLPNQQQNHNPAPAHR